MTEPLKGWKDTARSMRAFETAQYLTHLHAATKLGRIVESDDYDAFLRFLEKMEDEEVEP